LNAPIADNRKFIEYQWDPITGSIGSLPTYLQKRLLAINVTQNFSTPEYGAIENIITHLFVARLGIPLDCWIETVNAGINGETAQLAGVTDFFLPSGHTTNWTVLPLLHRIAKIPIQLNYGEFDMVRPQLIADTAVSLSMVECNKVPRAGHSVFLDSPMELFPIIRDFIARVELSVSSNKTFHPIDVAVCPGKFVTTPNYVSSQSTVTLSVTLLVAIVFIIFSTSLVTGVLIGRRWYRRSSSGYEMIGSR
jgi:hypothetical protein